MSDDTPQAPASSPYPLADSTPTIPPPADPAPARSTTIATPNLQQSTFNHNPNINPNPQPANPYPQQPNPYIQQPSPYSQPPAGAYPPLPRPNPGRPSGRRYGFLCSYCSSRLEATESMAGQSGTCPTCGNQIVIPILDHRGRLIDPTSGQIIKQDPHPVHAYAAAGHRAPAIITTPNGESKIKCPRCTRENPISANNCAGCGLPFTMDGTVGDAISGTNTWAVASLVLGIVTLVGGFCFIVPPLLAVIFGFIALRGANQSSTRSGSGLAIAGIIMGAIGTVISGLIIIKMITS